MSVAADLLAGTRWVILPDALDQVAALIERGGADLLAGTRWVIPPDALDQVAALIERGGADLERARAATAERQALAMQIGRPLPGARDTVLRDGVAVINIIGPIFRYQSVLAALIAGSTLDVIARDFAIAAAIPDVKAILLNIDSPGGEAAGIADFAQLVHTTSAIKPVVSRAGDMMASAALWIGAAASEIVLSPTAVVGSIGAVAVGLDTTARDAMQGIRRIVIRSTRTPLKGHGLDTEPGLTQIQGIVDALTEQFVAEIARFRGVSADRVLSDFGQGGLIARPHEAIRVGLADRVESLEGLITELAAGKSQFARRSAPRAALPSGTYTSAASLLASGAAARDREATAAAPAPARSATALSLDDQAKAEWQASARLRAEFGSFPTFLAWKRAENAGLTKMYGGTVVSGDREATAAVPAPFASPTAALSIEDQAKAEWRASSAVRAEFGDSFPAYLAWKQADRAGRARVYGGTVVTGAG